MMMVKRGTSTAVPRLRFPEFRETQAWNEKPLGEVAKFFKGKGLPKSEIVADGQAPCIHYGELFTAYSEVITEVTSRTQQKADAFISSQDDVLMPTSDVTPSGLAKASCLKSGGVILGGDILVIRTDQNSIYGEFLSRQIRHKEREVLKLVSGTTVFHLYPSSIEKLRITYPSVSEQQKIADCLTSLDEVIAAQGRKVEALKAHKRGLMQQLFPREGETRPRLRFPEFRDAQGWKSATVKTLISTITPPRKIPTSGYGAEGLLPIIDQSPDPICGWTNDLEAKVDARCPLIVFGDHTCVLKLVEHDFAQGADGIKIISALAHVDIHFLYFALQADPVSSASYRRHFSLLQEKHIAFPEELKEQQRIADCLSSLDAQITAESHHLASLKTHKQGLMQQLFPTPEAVCA